MKINVIFYFIIYQTQTILLSLLLFFIFHSFDERKVEKERSLEIEGEEERMVHGMFLKEQTL